MMNRIILIGNGFDLAHGLRTSYADFINGYRIFLKRRLLEGCENQTDGLCTIKIDNSEASRQRERFSCLLDNYSFRFQRGWQQEMLIREYNDFFDTLPIEYNSSFFESINKAIDTKKWVDIEAEYYSCLKQIFKHEKNNFTYPEQLNDELELIKKHLIDYLQFVQASDSNPEMAIDSIRKAIYEPFCVDDIANDSQTLFRQFAETRWDVALQGNAQIEAFLWKYKKPTISDKNDIEFYMRDLDFSKHIKDIYNAKARNLIPDYFLLPDQILFLNFNYTNTAGLYISENSEFKVNHIHGELGNDKNPIIFGYGDELDDDYKEISKLNDNDYLKNIKSIRYLETDNYRKLLSFIDSAPFQIYIMGHSCGNSDRTLLNTLFEHKNCVSIKPFYYKKPDGTDNYIEIVQNISRNFNDMRLMRDRVVNKTYCRPLVPRE